jgi:hypothetical protein
MMKILNQRHRFRSFDMNVTVVIFAEQFAGSQAPGNPYAVDEK